MSAPVVTTSTCTRFRRIVARNSEVGFRKFRNRFFEALAATSLGAGTPSTSFPSGAAAFAPLAGILGAAFSRCGAFVAATAASAPSAPRTAPGFTLGGFGSGCPGAGPGGLRAYHSHHGVAAFDEEHASLAFVEHCEFNFFARGSEFA